MNGRIRPGHGHVCGVVNLVGVEELQEFLLDGVQGVEGQHQRVVLEVDFKIWQTRNG
jgi:hypothetical protein